MGMPARLQPPTSAGTWATDGEGVEEFWSRLRNLISITRGSGVHFHLAQNIQFTNTYLQRSRRIWLIDRQSFAIGMELRANLGDWTPSLSWS